MLHNKLKKGTMKQPRGNGTDKNDNVKRWDILLVVRVLRLRYGEEQSNEYGPLIVKLLSLSSRFFLLLFNSCRSCISTNTSHFKLTKRLIKTNGVFEPFEARATIINTRSLAREFRYFIFHFYVKTLSTLSICEPVFINWKMLSSLVYLSLFLRSTVIRILYKFT